VAKDDLPNESMKTDNAMEFDSNKEILDNVGVDNEAQKSGRQKRKRINFVFPNKFCLCSGPKGSLLLANSAGGIVNMDRLWQFLHTGPRI
jgi:hypothetical protein